MVFVTWVEDSGTSQSQNFVELFSKWVDITSKGRKVEFRPWCSMYNNILSKY